MTTYDYELDERKLHVFTDYKLACLCCLRADPTLQRCKHRPQAEMRRVDDRKEQVSK